MGLTVVPAFQGVVNNKWGSPFYHHHKSLLISKPKESLSFPEFPKPCVRMSERITFYFAFAVMFTSVFTLWLNQPSRRENMLLIYTQYSAQCTCPIGHGRRNDPSPETLNGPYSVSHTAQSPHQRSPNPWAGYKPRNWMGARFPTWKDLTCPVNQPLSFGEGSPDIPCSKSSPKSTEASLSPVFHPQSIFQ